MKPLLYICAAALTIGSIAIAHAHFNGAAPRDGASSPSAEARTVEEAKRKTKRRHPFVRCRDGSVSYSRQNICTGHGGAR